MGRWVTLGLCVTMLWSHSLPALAQESDQVAEAKVVAANAAEFARQGQFEEAAALYEQAYAMDPAPVLLFNLAYVHEKRQAWGDAVATYERYIEVEADPTHRADARTRIAQIEARGRTLPVKQPEPATAGPIVAPAKKTGGSGTVKWVLIGSAAAAVIAGGIATAVILNRDDGVPSADAIWALPARGGK